MTGNTYKPLDFFERIGLYVALIHYPVLNREGQVVTSALTNVDVHDISRSARTFNVTRTFIVTPIQPQLDLINHIRDNWVEGSRGLDHPRRKDALTGLCPASSIDEAISAIRAETGKDPIVVTTSAKGAEDQVTSTELVTALEKQQRPALVLFGKGWGLAPQILEDADLQLEPVYGVGTYNHLSVRAAFAVVLDRLCQAGQTVAQTKVAHA